MDGDWSEVKTKPKKAKPQYSDGANMAQQLGGKKGKFLVAGAVQPASRGRYGGPGAAGNSAQNYEIQNHASAVADYDFNIEGDEEVKYETFSHTCAMSVKEQRTASGKTQTQLAKLVNEKTSAIVDLENESGRYNSDLINRIERALNCKVERGRKKKTGHR